MNDVDWIGRLVQLVRDVQFGRLSRERAGRVFVDLVDDAPVLLCVDEFLTTTVQGDQDVSDQSSV